MSEDFVKFDDMLIPVQLQLKDWGKLCGALRAMALTVDPEGTVHADLLGWMEQIQLQVNAAFDRGPAQEEAANEDAN